MTPFRFIKLHDRNGCTEVLVNVEMIVYIRDLRSDPVVNNCEGYKWTVIKTASVSLDVLETEEEIMHKISCIQ